MFSSSGIDQPKGIFAILDRFQLSFGQIRAIQNLTSAKKRLKSDLSRIEEYIGFGNSKKFGALPFLDLLSQIIDTTNNGIQLSLDKLYASMLGNKLFDENFTLENEKVSTSDTPVLFLPTAYEFSVEEETQALVIHNKLDPKQKVRIGGYDMVKQAFDGQSNSLAISFEENDEVKSRLIMSPSSGDLNLASQVNYIYQYEIANQQLETKFTTRNLTSLT